MSDPCICLEDLCFAYGDQRVLDGVSLSVGSGEIYGPVGADGAGKSTLLRLAIGQLRPQSGRIRVLGLDPQDPRIRRQIAYMPQGFGLYPDLTVTENLAFFADLHDLAGRDKDARIAQLLQRTGLERFPHRRAGQLSGGMMQKLALACALVSEPRAMFLDEPTTGVDPLSRRAFWRLLDGVRAEGVAILYATANLEEAERCDRVGLLEDGRLRDQGPPLDLSRVPDARPFRLSGPALRERLPQIRDLPGVDMVFPRGNSATLWLRPDADVEALRARLAALDPSLELHPAPPSLHEAILRRLAREAAHG